MDFAKTVQMYIFFDLLYQFMYSFKNNNQKRPKEKFSLLGKKDFHITQTFLNNGCHVYNVLKHDELSKTYFWGDRVSETMLLS